nr:immunoglobulin heavy chain junction region [Mus musculus]
CARASNSYHYAMDYW